MRTKTLLITAAVAAASSLALNAQVYSVNAVGYINLNIPVGWSINANQLNAADNSIAALIPTAPAGTTVYKFDPATGFAINSYDADFEEWDDPAMTLSPGEGWWVRSGEAFTITLVGEVPQGDLSTPLKAGFNLVSSQVPQAGKVSTDLGLPQLGGGTVYTYEEGAGFGISTYDADFQDWDPAEPTVDVGEGFWYRVGEDTSWDRNFSI